MNDDSNSFRDQTSFLDDEGHRKWLYPKKPSGKYYDYRKWVSYLLLIVFFAGPHIKIGGQPFLLLNILERQFIILGKIFWPEDFYILGLCLIAFVVFIALFTVVFGRLWCGWTCPQTVFMEMVFRRIEYFFEGDAPEQKALDRSPFTLNKALRKGGKWLTFFAISFLIANTFLAYIIGQEEWLQLVSSSPEEHWQGLLSLLVFTTVFFFVFAWAREQICIVVCPYGRLQSVLIDKNSLVVSYDYVRGEPRKHFDKRETVRSAGSCIDCKQCVAVCPMGIDIRNGIQLECTGCTACIDACDDIMEKLSWPKGLIRHDTPIAIEQKQPFVFNLRMKAYSAVLVAILLLISVVLFTRNQIETILLRVPGALYQTEQNGNITNVYTLKVLNKTQRPVPLTFKLISPKGKLTVAGGSVILPAGDHVEKALFLTLEPSEIIGLKTPVVIEIEENETLLETIKTNFVGPQVSKEKKVEP